jgi:hypothetical protein
MLKPDLSHFSHVRALGGMITKRSSFSTALTSPLAAHTMQRVREASPDLVKALLLDNADGQGFDPALGFGTAGIASLPWACRLSLDFLARCFEGSVQRQHRQFEPRYVSTARKSI